VIDHAHAFGEPAVASVRVTVVLAQVVAEEVLKFATGNGRMLQVTDSTGLEQSC